MATKVRLASLTPLLLIRLFGFKCPGPYFLPPPRPPLEASQNQFISAEAFQFGIDLRRAARFPVRPRRKLNFEHISPSPLPQSLLAHTFLDALSSYAVRKVDFFPLVHCFIFPVEFLAVEADSRFLHCAGPLPHTAPVLSLSTMITKFSLSASTAFRRYTFLFFITTSDRTFCSQLQ
jgi:hypothetical protein